MERSRAVVPPLDPSLYSLDNASQAFFKSSTGIYDDDELKEHILRVQAQAYTEFPYPCIRMLTFTKLRISKMPAYKDVLKLGQERSGAIFLDIGCCFGNDSRKAVSDGFPLKQVIASDLRPEFWDLGHVLFCSSPESFPVSFIAGNALDPTFLSPFSDVEETPDAEVNLSNIRTLNELRGRVSVIWAGSFFHLFSEENQRQVAHALGRLLSSESGSIIFGAHVGSFNKGTIAHHSFDSEKIPPIFCHSPASWKELWVGKPSDGTADNVDGLNAAVFSPDSVRIESALTSLEYSASSDPKAQRFVWSITRL